MLSFEELALSRREWIDEVLVPWCREAGPAELRKAEIEWTNLAGQVAAELTLWTWAWSRFPALVHGGMPGLNETLNVKVVLKSGQSVIGYPDNRESDRHQLVLLSRGDDGTTEHAGPYQIDEIESVELTDASPENSAAQLPARQPTTLPPHTPDHERI